MFEVAQQLLEENKENLSFNLPFFIGVFGTLRKGHGNSRLMGDAPNAESRSCPYHYQSWHKAFLPHFVATGLSLQCSKNSSAVFELYTYDSENWAKMIQPVDRLESFSPSGKHDYGYHRTLVWLHVLPDDFESPYYSGDGYSSWSERNRDHKIPVDEWNNYPKLPAWCYSSLSENKKCEKLPDSPIIWMG